MEVKITKTKDFSSHHVVVTYCRVLGMSEHLTTDDRVSETGGECQLVQPHEACHEGSTGIRRAATIRGGGLPNPQRATLAPVSPALRRIQCGRGCR